MMRNIAIGLAAVTIAIGGSTLSVSALQGQESGTSKDSMSRSVKSHRLAELTPLQREHLRKIVRERSADLTPMQREHIKGVVRERLADLTPTQRERIKEFVRDRID